MPSENNLLTAETIPSTAGEASVTPDTFSSVSGPTPASAVNSDRHMIIDGKICAKKIL